MQWGEASPCHPQAVVTWGGQGTLCATQPHSIRDEPSDSPGGSAALPSTAAQTPKPAPQLQGVGGERWHMITGPLPSSMHHGYGMPYPSLRPYKRVRGGTIHSRDGLICASHWQSWPGPFFSQFCDIFSANLATTRKAVLTLGSIKKHTERQLAAGLSLCAHVSDCSPARPSSEVYIGGRKDAECPRQEAQATWLPSSPSKGATSWQAVVALTCI